MADSDDAGDLDEQEDAYEDDDDEDEDDLHRLLPDKAMAYEGMTISLLRMKSRMETQRMEHAQDKEAERLADKATLALGAADNLRAMLKHRHHSYTAGWRLSIDRSMCHHVGKSEFVTAMREMGMPDDSKVIWSELGGNRGHVSLADIDSTSARILSDFYQAFREKIGRDVNDLVKDTDSLRIDKEGFVKRCQAVEKMPSGDGFMDLHAVFRALKLDAPYVTASDLYWLDHYCQRGHKSEPVKTEEEEKWLADKAEAKVRHDQKAAVQAFRTLLQHKFGGVITAWRRVIDPDQRGRLPSEDLKAACVKVGFIGSTDTDADKQKFDNLWYALAGRTGYVAKLEELEPQAVRALEGFKRGCIGRFGSITIAFRELMGKNKPMVTRDEFIMWCKEVRVEHGSDKLLWTYLDERGTGQINMDIIDRDATTAACSGEACDRAADMFEGLETLPRKPPHVTLVQREVVKNEANKVPLEQQRNHTAELNTMLQTKFGSSVRGWRKALDPQGKGKLSRDEFFVGCAVAGFAGNLANVWRELGLKEKSNIRLKDLDPACGEDIRVFRERCIDRIGSVHDALGKVSKSKSKINPKVTEEEFKALYYKLGLEGDHEKLFAHLDAPGRGVLSATSLKWLKDIPDTDEKALARKLSRDVDVRKKKQAEKLAAKAPPTAKMAEEMKAKSEETRALRGTKVEMIDMRNKLLNMLGSDYHSVGRGWQIAMDPDRISDLQMDDFLTGLERLGMLKQDATDAELTQAEKLFHFLENEETHYVTLASLDRGLTDAALEDLQRHLAVRYNGVQKAFEMWDPLGSGEVSIADFNKMCQESKFTSGIHRLAMYLDPNKTGLIDLSQIDHEMNEGAKEFVLGELECKETNIKIMKKKRKAYFRETPTVGVFCGVEARDKVRETREGVTALKAFKKALNFKFGSLQRAWQKFLSPEGESTIGYKTFAQAFKALEIDGESDQAWEALGLARGQLSLRELDPSVEQDLVEFKKRMIERFGSTQSAMNETDIDDSWQADYDTFLNLCFECQYRRNERRLFEFYGGEYKVKGSKIELSKIDEKAVEQAKEKRTEDKERKDAETEEDNYKAEVLRRRKKGLPDDPDDDELAELEAKKERAAKKLFREEQKQMRKSADFDEASPTGSNDTGGEAAPPPVAAPPPPPPRAGADPLELFRAMFMRRFYTATRAWRVLDCQRQVCLNKSEFCSSLRVTGYGGSGTVLWNALGVKQTVALKDIDPKAFELLATFRNLCSKHVKGLRKVFHVTDGRSTTRMDFNAFTQVCQKIRCPRPWDPVFELLDTKCVGSITWEEVKFLEEDYKWIKGAPMPVRRAATPLGGSRNNGEMLRTEGLGHLGIEMKPRKVFLPKTNSLPNINPQLKANWNERHVIAQNMGNKTDNLIHLMKYVECQDEIRIARRVRKRLLALPTEQWLAENMPDDYAEEDDDDEDEGWAMQTR